VGDIVSGFGVPSVGDEPDPWQHLYRACRVLREHRVDTSTVELFGQHPSLNNAAVSAVAGTVCRAELFMATNLTDAYGAQELVHEAAAVALRAIMSASVQEGPVRV